MGSSEWTRFAKRLVGAGEYFQQTLSPRGSKRFTVHFPRVVYRRIEDILLYAHTKREFIARVLFIVERMSKYKLILNSDKCAFGMSKVEFVGHLLSSAGNYFSETKKRKLTEFKMPYHFKDIKSFLDISGITSIITLKQRSLYKT